MNKEIKREWTHALRSGKYKQGNGQLKTSSGKFCCLGVLCDIMGVGWNNGYPLDQNGNRLTGGLDIQLPDVIVQQAGLGHDGRLDRPVVILSHLGKQNIYTSGTYISLSMANDGGMTFKEIANVIDQQL